MAIGGVGGFLAGRISLLRGAKARRTLDTLIETHPQYQGELRAARRLAPTQVSRSNVTYCARRLTLAVRRASVQASDCFDRSATA